MRKWASYRCCGPWSGSRGAVEEGEKHRGPIKEGNRKTIGIEKSRSHSGRSWLYDEGL